MGTLFTTYNIAKELLDLSFDEYCNAYIKPDEEIHHSYGRNSVWKGFERVGAPTFQQVIEWFESEHGFEIITKSWKEGGKIVFLYSVNKLGNPSSYRHGDFSSNTRREAIEKGIWSAIKIIKK